MAKTEKQNQQKNSLENQRQKGLGQLKEYLNYSGIAFQFIAVILLAFWIGQQLDDWLGLKIPAFTIFLILSSIIGSLVILIRNLPKK